uniref:Uncharacterized protein n=1 Tax=Compsopogon caeruleus TaxID=31354 RepID=A0A7S1TAW5_9RHOD
MVRVGVSQVDGSGSMEEEEGESSDEDSGRVLDPDETERRLVTQRNTLMNRLSWPVTVRGAKELWNDLGLGRVWHSGGGEECRKTVSVRRRRIKSA